MAALSVLNSAPLASRAAWHTPRLQASRWWCPVRWTSPQCHSPAAAGLCVCGALWVLAELSRSCLLAVSPWLGAATVLAVRRGGLFGSEACSRLGWRHCLLEALVADLHLEGDNVHWCGSLWVPGGPQSQLPIHCGLRLGAATSLAVRRGGLRIFWMRDMSLPRLAQWALVHFTAPLRIALCRGPFLAGRGLFSGKRGSSWCM